MDSGTVKFVTFWVVAVSAGILAIALIANSPTLLVIWVLFVLTIAVAAARHQISRWLLAIEGINQIYAKEHGDEDDE